jgi:hypothetical protein
MPIIVPPAICETVGFSIGLPQNLSDVWIFARLIAEK